MATKMVSRNEEVEVEVTQEDQERINTFSYMNLKKHELLSDISEIDEELNKVNDAEGEIYTSDSIKFAVGECYVDVDCDEADDLIQQEKSSLESRKESAQAELKDLDTEMKTLKGILYGKYGKSINLDEDPKQ